MRVIYVKFRDGLLKNLVLGTNPLLLLQLQI